MAILAYSTLFRSRSCRMPLSYLDRLEAESIFIFREVVAIWDNPVLLYSIGKDSSVLLHLARKAFYPAPLLHVDTTWKFRATIEFSRCSGQAARHAAHCAQTRRDCAPASTRLPLARARQRPEPWQLCNTQKASGESFRCFRCDLGRCTRARRQSDGQIWLISGTLTAISRLVQWDLAERQGFEPWVRFHAHTLSKRAP